MALNLSNLPLNSSVAENRYRLVVVATGEARGKQVSTEMALLDPSGKAVWSGYANSGGKSNFLPGLTSDLGRGITAQYPIEWNRISTNRTDELGREGMSYSNGAAGYFVPLGNASNMGELGGAGRSAFGIHPNGTDASTRGCTGFTDANGKINATSDKTARDFLKIMQSLPASERPTALEVINPKIMRTGAPDRSKEVAEAGKTNDGAREAEAQNSRNTARDGDMNSVIMSVCKSIFGAFLPEWLVELIFGDNSALNENERDNTEIPHSEKVSSANSIRDSKAIPKWKAFQQEEGNGEKVQHSNPVRGDVTVTSSMGRRNTGIKGASTNHKGLDLIGGSDILASAKGIVLFSGRATGYGNLVVIGHADGTETRYGHMTGSQMPKVGERVEQGEQIGVMGKSGVASGVHLHYEQRVNGVARNPLIDGKLLAKGDDLDTHARTDSHDHDNKPAKGSKMAALAAALDADHGDKPTPNVPKMSKIARIAAGSSFRS